LDDAALAKARKLAAKRINERLKLLASFFNALALGVIGAGFIVPVVNEPGRLISPQLPWLGLGLVLHLSAQGVLLFLRSED
jgi:hypothetical protein